ncbi:unnamed protein product [Mytilus coruscus]|uniref:Uncharacterized protein n=1 Tax=Mytilus coruscus TaxID=42192 RepID=A0A6J8DS06_MYTCO|nr:unnamed protein product [Mytilus coruscus]
MSERGFISVSWNFHENDHGKGAPDGIGGALTRAANRHVLQGKDILDTASFIKSFNGKDSNIALVEVSRKEVEKNSKILSNLNLKTVSGTLKMHQLFITAFGEIEYRDISCFCRKDSEHSGHELKCFKFHVLYTELRKQRKGKICRAIYREKD